MNAPRDHAELERALRLAERRIRQLERDFATTHSLYEQGKRALLRNYSELEHAVKRLRATAVELGDAKERAEAASVAKSRFLATISHEMRTPLNGILGSIELLLGTSATEEQLELIQLTHQSARSLLLIINDVLDFSKAEAGGIRLEQVGFDLPACVRAVSELCANAARSKGVEVRWNVAPDVPRLVTGDPTRLRQVLLNLADNAVKFTAQGWVELSVRRGTDARLQFSVNDTGIGIQPSALERIFEPFTQEDDTTTRRFGGTGLGLAICRRLVTLMGGELRVESAPGRGSTFRFEAQLPACNEAELAAPSAALPGRSRDFAGTRVLLVDDNRGNLLIGRKMLERLGVTVETADNGADATRRVSEFRFDLVLMDCSMPVMDGFEATAAIRALEGKHAGTQIVAMTAYAMTGDRERCLEAGMDDYLPKPVRLPELVAVLERAQARAAERLRTV